MPHVYPCVSQVRGAYTYISGPWGSCAQRAAKGVYPDDYCYTMSEAEMLRFEDYTFLFSGGPTLVLGPRQYVYELRTGVWCMGIFNNGHPGTVIGAATMRNHEVVTPQASILGPHPRPRHPTGSVTPPSPTPPHPTPPLDRGDPSHTLTHPHTS